MTCASCAQTTGKALTEQDGVEQANVNFASEKAYMNYDSQAINKKRPSSKPSELPVTMRIRRRKRS